MHYCALLVLVALTLMLSLDVQGKPLPPPVNPEDFAEISRHLRSIYDASSQVAGKLHVSAQTPSNNPLRLSYRDATAALFSRDNQKQLLDLASKIANTHGEAKRQEMQVWMQEFDKMTRPYRQRPTALFSHHPAVTAPQMAAQCMAGAGVLALNVCMSQEYARVLRKRHGTSSKRKGALWRDAWLMAALHNAALQTALRSVQPVQTYRYLTAAVPDERLRLLAGTATTVAAIHAQLQQPSPQWANPLQRLSLPKYRLPRVPNSVQTLGDNVAKGWTEGVSNVAQCLQTKCQQTKQSLLQRQRVGKWHQ